MDDIIINKENRKVKIIKIKDDKSVQGENNNIYPQRIGRPKIIKEEGEIYPKRKVGRPKKENALSVKEYNKQYYENNKEYFLKLVPCDICEISVCYGCKSRHFKSKNHLRNLEIFKEIKKND